MSDEEIEELSHVQVIEDVHLCNVCGYIFKEINVMKVDDSSYKICNECFKNKFTLRYNDGQENASSIQGDTQGGEDLEISGEAQ